MELQGLHHITMITADAQSNVDFYADTLGLRLVKKTVNFDSPDAYHLYFGDEAGSPGTILTWFEFAGARRGRAGAGMIHTIALGVASEEALSFWAKRLQADPRDFTDPDGLRLQLVVSGAEPKRAIHPEIPEEYAITGIVGARAYGQSGPHPLLTDTLGFTATADGFELGGFAWGYDAPPAERGLLGAGTVHHIAWASRDEDHLAWRRAVAEAGASRQRCPRPRLLPVDLLRRAARDPVRDRDALAGLRRRRGARAPRRGAAPAVPARAPAPPVGERAHPGRQPAYEGAGPMTTFRERPAAGDPEGLLILHHGRGSDENDLLGLADVLDPERRLHVVTPRAPLSLGGPGYHWYVVPRVGYPDHDTFHAAYQRLASFHDEVWERTGIDSRADDLRRLLDGLGDVATRSGSGPTARRRRGSWPSAASSRRSTAGSPTSRATRACSSPTGGATRSWKSGFAQRANALLVDAGMDVSYHESDAGAPHRSGARAGGRVDWVGATLRSGATRPR